jgi:hypothetical protein
MFIVDYTKEMEKLKSSQAKFPIRPPSSSNVPVNDQSPSRKHSLEERPSSFSSLAQDLNIDKKPVAPTSQSKSPSIKPISMPPPTNHSSSEQSQSHSFSYAPQSTQYSSLNNYSSLQSGSANHYIPYEQYYTLPKQPEYSTLGYGSLQGYKYSQDAFKSSNISLEETTQCSACGNIVYQAFLADHVLSRCESHIFQRI